MDHLRRLIDHLAWADRRVFETLRDPAPIGPAVEMFAHILGAEHIWLARLEGRPPTVPVWPPFGLDECARLAEENRAGLTRFVAALTPERLDAGIAYTNSAGQSYTSAVEDILIHVCMHGAYHRGQIMTLLRTAGRGTASADYIAYIRGTATASRTGR